MIMSMDDDDNGSRPSSCSSPLLLIETLTRKKSFSYGYGKLPLQLITLTVVKLDGSSFDISVAKNPTLAQLKQAVEDAFNQHGIPHVSWSHVWAQFCLCFNGHKLLHDQQHLGIHGIKDGDQLQFVRHTSTSYNLVKERSEKPDYKSQESKLSGSKEKEEKKSEEVGVNITCYCTWAHLWKRLFSSPPTHHTN